MPKQILFVQGGGEGAYAEDETLVTALQDELGAKYRVCYPAMPGESQPRYEEWKDMITEEIETLNGEIILVGHSLGGSLLLKILSEETVPTALAGLFLLAPPYWGVEDWQVGEYQLRDDFAKKLPDDVPIFFYHSRDDEWVPFEHQALYAEALPQATVHQFSGRGHHFDNDLFEVARDIEQLS